MDEITITELRNRYKYRPNPNTNTTNNDHPSITEKELNTPLLQNVQNTSKRQTKQNPKQDKWEKIFKYRFYIIVLYIGLLYPIGLFCQPKLIKATDSSYQVIDRTPSHEANNVYEKYYLPSDDYNRVDAPPILILLEQVENFNESMVDGSSDLYKSTKLFVNNFARYIREYSSSCVTTVENYYEYEELGLYTLGVENYVRNNGAYLLLVVTTTLSHGKDTYNFITDVQDYGVQFLPNELKIHYTGLPIFQKDMLTYSIRNNIFIIIIVLPIILLLSCIILHCNVYIMIVPLAMSSITMTLWCIILWPLIRFHNYQMSQITPTIIWCIAITISFQYTYVLLSTIQSQLKQKQSLIYYNKLNNISSSLVLHDIVQSSLDKIARVYGIINNLSLFLIFFGYILCSPVEVLTNYGIAAYIAIIGCLICSMTFVPAVVFTKFGHSMILYSLEVSNPYCCLRNKDDNDIQLIEPMLPPKEDTQSLPVDTIEVMERDTIDTTMEETFPKPIQDDIDKLQNGAFFKFARKFITNRKRCYGMLGLITCVFIGPMIYFLTEFRVGVNVKLTLPTDSSGLDTYDTISDEYTNKGYLYPYKLIFDGKPGNQSLTSQVGFDTMHYVYNQLTTRANERSDDDIYQGISILNQTLVSYTTYRNATQCGIYCDDENYASIAYINSNYTANDYVTYISILLKVDVFSHDGTDWLTDARNILQELQDNDELNDIDVYIQGGATTAYDTMNRLYHKILPKFISITSIIVLSFLCIVHKSLWTMIRCTISIGYTFIFTFGFTVAVYQYGIFARLSIRAVSNDIDEISVWSPVLAFGIIFGLLGVTYNNVVLCNILQFRLAGYTHISSVLLGIQSSYSTITILECILLVIFGSLLFITTNLTLNTLGLMIVVATLFHMAIVRPFLDPVIFGLMEGYWWPRNLPREEKDLLGDPMVDGDDDINFLCVRSEMDSLRMSVIE